MTKQTEEPKKDSKKETVEEVITPAGKFYLIRSGKDKPYMLNEVEFKSRKK